MSSLNSSQLPRIHRIRYHPRTRANTLFLFLLGLEEDPPWCPREPGSCPLAPQAKIRTVPRPPVVNTLPVYFVLSRLALIAPSSFPLIIWALSFFYITVLFGCSAVNPVYVCVNISWHHEWLHDFLFNLSKSPRLAHIAYMGATCFPTHCGLQWHVFELVVVRTQMLPASSNISSA